jgi:serine/threonine-protein kinase
MSHTLSVCPTCKAVFRTAFRACPRDGELLVDMTNDPLIGTSLVDRYLIEGLIGGGGLGRVYRARHTRMSRRYAIKVPFGEVAYDPKVRVRFANEAEAASRLAHPNVIGVVDFGETPEGLLYMAMDYAEGQTLAELIAQNGPLAREWVVRFTRQIAEGLAHAHDRGLIHRDLKPDNVIIERDGDRPRIVDFGLAIFREQEGGARLTTQGTVLGTPHYMAPEQATGQALDGRTDLFALGLIMYEMLCGKLPFEGSPVQVARANLSAPMPLISERVPGLDVDASLEAVCRTLVEKRPEDRPPSAHALIEMLDRLAMDGRPTWEMDRIEPAARQRAQSPALGAGPAAIAAAASSVRVHSPAPNVEVHVGSTPSGAGAVIHSPVVEKRAADAVAVGNAPTVQVQSTPPAAVASLIRPDSDRNDVIVPAKQPAPLAPGYVSEPIDALPIRDRRPIIVIGAAIALVVIVLVGWRLVGGGDDTATATTADAETVASITVDAAVAEPPPADAGMVAIVVADASPAVAPVDARITVADRKPDARVVAVARPDARPATRPIDAATVATSRPDAAAAPETSKATLTAEYKRIGAKIDKLVREGTDPRARSLADRYSKIAYLDALNNPNIRSDVMAALRALSRDLD